MSSKFTKEEIDEIASKLEWKPNNLTYMIFYTVIALSIFSLLLVIYLTLLHNDLKCKFRTINNRLEELEEKTNSSLHLTNDLQSNFMNNSNEIRYLTRRSERNMDNSSLSEKVGYEMPIFANEKENTKLFSALNGM
jgi:Flp pilus assembly pilin Flp